MLKRILLLSFSICCIASCSQEDDNTKPKESKESKEPKGNGGTLHGPKDEILRYLFEDGSLKNGGTLTSNDLEGFSGNLTKDRYGRDKCAIKKGEGLMSKVFTEDTYNITLSFWIKSSTEPTSKKGIISFIGNSSKGFEIFQESGKIGWKFKGNNGVIKIDKTTKVTDIYNNKWHNIVLSAQKVKLFHEVKIFVDGKNIADLNNDLTETIGYITTKGKLKIGDYSGEIDDIRLYNRVLKDSEIKELNK